MCFELDSLPPIPVIAGAAVSHEHLELEATDGNSFAAFGARPEDPAPVGVVILPDVRGLYRFYEELALRFAERGYAAVAFDYFGRTAGVSERDDDFAYMEHVARTTPTGIQADVAAVVALPPRARRAQALHGRLLLRRTATPGSPPPAATGSRGRSASTAIPGSATAGRARPHMRGEIEAPILALQAGVDQNITPELNAAFDAALTDAAVEHELVVYEGAPHSFFDRKAEEYREASDDAWRRTLDFIERH